MNTKLVISLHVITAIITTPSESATPYSVSWGPAELVHSFNIRGCHGEWCELVEDTDYHIEINFTMPADVSYPRMTYSLYSGLADGIYGYMPIVCGSLANTWCPLTKGRNVTYSSPFRLQTSSKWREFGHNNILTHFYVDLLGEDNDETLMSFLVKIKFTPCFLYAFDVCIIHWFNL